MSAGTIPPRMDALNLSPSARKSAVDFASRCVSGGSPHCGYCARARPDAHHLRSAHPEKCRCAHAVVVRGRDSRENRTTSDPGRLLLTGQLADLGVMDVTELHGISKTAPYFHNNSAATLEEVLDHYDAFFRHVSRLNPPPNLPVRCINWILVHAARSYSCNTPPRRSRRMTVGVCESVGFSAGDFPSGGLRFKLR